MPDLNGAAARPGVRLVIGGDFCPINANESACVRGDAQTLFGGLLEAMRGADFCVVNLECPLIDYPAPIEKIGPAIGANREAAKVLPAAGVDAVTLANNHIMDHGPVGLASTVAACEEQGIAYFGAGDDIAAARKILVREIGGIRVGFLGVTHHEFSVATATSPGAASMDPVEVYAQIRSQEDRWHHLVALVHAGPDQYPWPTPWLQKYCRFLVEIGASVVVCQHSHCSGAVEVHNGALIVYGQGNLVFDWLPKPNPDWFRGFLIEVALSASGIVSYGLLPYERGNTGVGAQLLTAEAASAFRKEIEEASMLLADPVGLESRWREYCVRRANSYYQQLLGALPGSNFFRRVADRLGVSVVPLRARHRMILLNLIRCEAHREALETILSDGERERGA